MTSMDDPHSFPGNDQQPFFQAARSGNNAPWAYAATLALVIALILAGNVCLAVPLVLFNRTADLTRLPALETLVSLLVFGLVSVGLWLGMRLIHRRAFSSLFAPAMPFRWKLAFYSAALWLALSGLGDLVLSRWMPGTYSLTFDAKQFFPYLVVALLLFPLQVSAEELLFRGYLTQALGLAVRRFWLPLVAPAVIFGLLHGFNPEVLMYGALWLLPTYIGIGLLLGWITLRSQGLEMAMGLHLANNLYSTLIVTFVGSALSSPAVFSIQVYNAAAGLVVFIVTAAIFLLLSKRAGWLTFHF
jgi:membrane protease YdiL (CAAX protease family)